MKKLSLALVLLVALLMTIITPIEAEAAGAEKQPVLREWNEDGSAHTGGEIIGFTNVVRRDTGISGTTHVHSLRPDGVYTFWIVAVLPEFFPDETDFSLVYVARGNSRVVGQNGSATVRWSARSGDASIVPPPGPIFDDALDRIDERIIRIEIAYHGLADAAPDEATLDQWLSDFWSGDHNVCADPPFAPTNGLPPGDQGALQPHCPVNFASTHVPD